MKRAIFLALACAVLLMHIGYTLAEAVAIRKAKSTAHVHKPFPKMHFDADDVVIWDDPNFDPPGRFGCWNSAVDGKVVKLCDIDGIKELHLRGKLVTVPQYTDSYH